MADRLRVDQLGQRRARPQPVRLGKHQGRAGQQRHDQLPERRVEAERGELEHTVTRADDQAVQLGGEQAGHSGVGRDDALGLPGGAGGEDDVRGVAEVERATAFQVRDVVSREAVQRSGVERDVGRPGR